MSRPSHQWDTSAVKQMKIENEPTITANLPPIVDPLEAERCIEKLKKFQIEEVGSKEWMAQHRVLERLNLQAHQNAMTNSDEYIMEAIMTFDKFETILHDLLLIDVWKDNVFPLLLDELAGKNSMRLYFVLYHEATLINMLEVFLYNKHVCENGGEKMIELVDYLAKKLARLNDTSEKFRNHSGASSSSSSSSRTLQADNVKEYATALANKSPKEELQQQLMDIDFRVCVSAVSVARFMCEYADAMPLSVASRMTDTHDLLVLLIPLIENPPWTRRLDSGKWQKLIDHNWQDVQPIDLLKVTKLEGQPWLAVYFLLAKDIFRERYYLNSFRKNQLLRVRKYLNEMMLDQLPFLADIQRYMDELAITEVPEPSSIGGNNSVFMFQQVAMIREGIMKGKNWQDVADYQVEKVFTMSDRGDTDLLAMAELYSDDLAESVIEGRVDA